MAVGDVFWADKAAVRPSRTEFRAQKIILSTRDIRAVFLIFGGFLLLRLVAMASLPFMDTTEARYAEIARKMVETGNWITPQFDYGVPFWGKPPLHTWLSAGGMELFGINEFAARLPVLLTSGLVLGLIWWWVAGIAGRTAALIALAVLFSTGLFFGASAFVMTDMPLTLGTTLVMVGFWNAVCRSAPNPVWGVLMFAGLAIGLLAKGPVAAVLCGIPIVLWLLLNRNWPVLKSLPWGAGAAALILLTVPWYALAEQATPGFLHYFFVGEHFERFVVPGWRGDLYGNGHSEPKGQIWLFWLGAALPWSLVLIPLVWRAKTVAQAFRSDRSGWLSYLSLWAIAPLILFTPAANILPAYTLPGLPAFAVLVVALCTAIWPGAPGRERKGLFVVSAGAMFLVFAGFLPAAELWPDTVLRKSQKSLVAAATQIDPDLQMFTVGGRSYSAEFYTGGSARAVAIDALPEIGDGSERIGLSVPETLAGDIDPAAYEKVGKFGRHLLYLQRPGQEVR